MHRPRRVRQHVHEDAVAPPVGDDDADALLRQMADMNANGAMLYPKPGKARLLFDHQYIMASLGVMSKSYPKEALALMKRSMGL